MDFASVRAVQVKLRRWVREGWDGVKRGMFAVVTLCVNWMKSCSQSARNRPGIGLLRCITGRDGQDHGRVFEYLDVAWIVEAPEAP